MRIFRNKATISLRIIFEYAVIATCAILSACGRPSETNIQLTGINYTDEYISSFLVNGYDGANIFPHVGGGSYVCCVTIPTRWRPGLNVTVRWTNNYLDEKQWKQKVVDIPEYKLDEIGFLAVHFYPNDIVKILITNKSSRFPGYPYPEPRSEKR